MEKIVLKVKHMTVFPVVQIRSRLHMKKKNAIATIEIKSWV